MLEFKDTSQEGDVLDLIHDIASEGGLKNGLSPLAEKVFDHIQSLARYKVVHVLTDAEVAQWQSDGD